MPGRPRTLSLLRAYLNARVDSAEEKTTAVLAATLRADPTLAWRLLADLGVSERGDLIVDTEVLAGASGEDRIDIELRVLDTGGEIKRVWIEAKLFASFSRRHGREAAEHQLVRYRRALDEYDSQRGDASRSTLVALVLEHSIGRPEDHIAVRSADVKVRTWQEIADLIGLHGADGYGQSWRQQAGDGAAVRPLAALDTLLWFLEDAIAPTGVQYVGVTTSLPLTADGLRLYSEAQAVAESITGVGNRVCDVLMRDGWTAKPLAPDPEYSPLTYMADLERASGRTPRWRQGAHDGDLYFQIAPYDQRMSPKGPTPTLWVGVEFKKSVRLGVQALEQLAAAGMRPEEDQDGSGRTQWVGSFAELEEVLSEAGPTVGDQAGAIAGWITERVGVLEGIRVS